MKSILFLLPALLILSACSQTFYIVRHAEKEGASTGSTMSSPGDPALSDAGKKRAEALKEELRNKKIQYIFSTQTRRTLATADPLHEVLGIRINFYNTDTLANFISRLKSIKKGNVLVIGHSNTVDDISNKLTGETKITGDLKDSEYDNLFIIERKGDHFSFTRKKYGKD